MKLNYIIHSIPGFRSKNPVKIILGSSYYIFILIIAFPSFPLILMGFFFPAIFVFLYEMIKTKDIEKIVPLLISILIFGISFYFGKRDLNNYIESKNSSNNNLEDSSTINERRFESEEEAKEKEREKLTEDSSLNDYYIPAFVEKVIDSENIIILRKGSNDSEKVKLLGISSPKSYENRKRNDEDANATLSYSKNLIENRKVYLEADQEIKDENGNYLYYIWIKQPDSINVNKNDVLDKMYNAQLIKNGYSRTEFYPPNTKYQNWFEEFEKNAQKNNWGIWSE